MQAVLWNVLTITLNKQSDPRNRWRVGRIAMGKTHKFGPLSLRPVCGLRPAGPMESGFDPENLCNYCFRDMPSDRLIFEYTEE